MRTQAEHACVMAASMPRTCQRLGWGQVSMVSKSQRTQRSCHAGQPPVNHVNRVNLVEYLAFDTLQYVGLRTLAIHFAVLDLPTLSRPCCLRTTILLLQHSCTHVSSAAKQCALRMIVALPDDYLCVRSTLCRVPLRGIPLPNLSLIASFA